jgi:hypothetical protein
MSGKEGFELDAEPITLTKVQRAVLEYIKSSGGKLPDDETLDSLVIPKVVDLRLVKGWEYTNIHREEIYADYTLWVTDLSGNTHTRNDISGIYLRKKTALREFEKRKKSWIKHYDANGRRKESS